MKIFRMMCYLHAYNVQRADSVLAADHLATSLLSFDELACQRSLATTHIAATTFQLLVSSCTKSSLELTGPFK